MCFNPWQQLRDPRARSQQQLIDWPLMFGIWSFTHGRKTQLPGRMRTALRVSISRRLAEIWLRSGAARNRKTEEKPLSSLLSMCLQNVSCCRWNMTLVALLKLFPLGCSFCSKGNWLWDTAYTCYQRTAADSRYQVNPFKQTQSNAMWSFCHITRTVLQKGMWR